MGHGVEVVWTVLFLPRAGLFNHHRDAEAKPSRRLKIVDIVSMLSVYYSTVFEVYFEVCRGWRCQDRSSKRCKLERRGANQ